MVESKDELKKILNDFWLLDVNEYSIIKDLIKDAIERYEKLIRQREETGFKEGTDDERYYYEEKRMIEFYIVMKEKVDYIISKGLCKTY